MLCTGNSEMVGFTRKGMKPTEGLEQEAGARGMHLKNGAHAISWKCLSGVQGTASGGGKKEARGAWVPTPTQPPVVSPLAAGFLGQSTCQASVLQRKGKTSLKATDLN